MREIRVIHDIAIYISAHLASLFYLLSFVTVNRRDGITPRFVTDIGMYTVHIHKRGVARPSSLCLINSLREVRGCAIVGC